MPSSNVKMSVALVTRNGPERLRRCLESLRAQSVQPCEVVVSDDSTSDFIAETKAISESYGCRYIEGPRRGLYANRNHAALACHGTHIRTMDDDHTFPEGHFAACLVAVESEPEAIWTTGEVGLFAEGGGSPPASTANQLHSSGVGTIITDPNNHWAISDGSTIYPAAVFARGFRMIEDYSYGSAYLEFGAFLYHHGFRSRSVPGALVEHHMEADTIHRNALLSIDRIESQLNASLAYNLYFKPDIMAALKYTAAAVRASRFSLSFVARIPRIVNAVSKRWNPRN